MKIEIEIDEQELWETVFGSSPFSFGDWFTEAEYLGDASWEKAGKMRIVGTNDKDETIEKVITPEDLARALPIANKQVHMDLFNFEDYDAICADAVIQVAMFGKVIYG